MCVYDDDNDGDYYNEKKNTYIESTQANFYTKYFNVATNDCFNW